MRAFLDRESPDILEAIDRRSKHYGWANRAFGQGVREHFRELAKVIPTAAY